MNVDLGPGAIVAGRYRLDRLLGRGGMGQVWAATHEVTLRTAALKFLNAPVHLRAERRRRFLREARAASAVQHPNVVQIHDFFELEDGTPVMVMDLLEGETLGQRLKRAGTLSLGEAVDVLLPVVSAVGTAHALGIVHRDLKPDNVFIASTPGGAQVKVLDFGIAKLTASAGDESEGGLTGTGAVLGTPRYMSPEQIAGDDAVDHRTDIWSIGVMLYEALSGSRPIEGENLCRIVHRLMNDGITPLRVIEPGLPGTVLSLVDRMLTRDAAARPEDLREVRDVLAPHGTVSVPAFAQAIAERQLSPDSSPGSVPGSSRPLSVPPAEPSTLTDVAPTEAVGDASIDVEFTGAHALSVRRSARTRRWSFALGVSALIGAGVCLRHFIRAPEGEAKAAARSASPPRPVAAVTEPAEVSPAEVHLAASPPSPVETAVGPARRRGPASRPAKPHAAAEQSLRGPVVPVEPAPPALPDRPRQTGLVEEPPF